MAGGTLTGGQVRNAGTIIGNGTVSADVHNFGQVISDSATLTLLGNGSSTDGVFAFQNNSQIRIWAPTAFDLHGYNTVVGDGSLEIAHGKVRATDNEFTGIVGGGTIIVSGGSLSADAGSELRLNLTGGGKVALVGGNIGASGTVINVGNFEFNGGKIGGSGSGVVVNRGSLVWTDGDVSGNLLNESSTFTISAPGSEHIHILAGGSLTNTGVITQAGNSMLCFGGVGSSGSVATLNNEVGAVYDLQGDGSMRGGYVSPFYNAAPGVFNNAGLFRKSGGTGTSTISDRIAFNNTGRVELASGTLSFGNFTQTAGSIDLDGGNLTYSSPAEILGGEIRGSGTINGSVLNTGGLVSPGHSPGAIVINGNYTQGVDGMQVLNADGRVVILRCN